MNHFNTIYDTAHLRAEARWIIDTLTKEYTVSKTFLCTSIKNGRKSVEYTVKDLGDYVPFFLYFGYEEFCKQHLKDIVLLLRGDLLKPQSKLLRVPVSSTYDHSDFMLGLLDYTDMVEDPDIEIQLKKTAEAVHRTYFSGPLPASYYCPTLRRTLPIFETKDGMYIEMLVDLYRRYGDSEYLRQAEDLFEAMVSVKQYERCGLWPVLVLHGTLAGRLAALIAPVKRQSETIRLMKNNTNTIFGFISLYNQTEADETAAQIDSWVSAVERTMISGEGMVYNFATLNGLEVIPYEANLTAAFTMIDLLCDCSHFLKEQRYLRLAQKVADFWLKRQGRTGLFPLRPEEQGSYLDSETDMIIALIKLHELTGNPVYKDSARKAFSGLLQYHRTDSGYCLSVDKDTGEITDSMYKTKFIALMLKVFIVFIEGKSIYKNPHLYNLLRDR